MAAPPIFWLHVSPSSFAMTTWLQGFAERTGEHGLFLGHFGLCCPRAPWVGTAGSCPFGGAVAPPRPSPPRGNKTSMAATAPPTASNRLAVGGGDHPTSYACPLEPKPSGSPLRLPRTWTPSFADTPAPPTTRGCRGKWPCEFPGVVPTAEQAQGLQPCAVGRCLTSGSEGLSFLLHWLWPDHCSLHASLCPILMWPPPPCV